MASYTVKAKNTSGETGTIDPDKSLRYSKLLDEINEADIKLSASGETKRSLIEEGAEIEIFKDGTLEFKGIIDMVDSMKAGTQVIHASGYEWRLTKERGTYSNSPWKNTQSATIFNDILSESSYLSVGTIESGFAIDFRVNDAQSLWNAASNLARKTQQDISINYGSLTVDVLNHKGSSTSIATLNEGINISNLRVTRSYPKGNKIIVYGKGDGANQIKATAEDSTSISTYGTIPKTIIDRSIVSQVEAQAMADSELKKNKSPAKVYDFDMNNPDFEVEAGDHLTINSQDTGLNNEEVRVVGVDRGTRGDEQFLTLQVTNPDLSTVVRKRNKILAELKKSEIDTSSYMQGSGNTQHWGNAINAKNGAPCQVVFFLSDSMFRDEAGNFQVKSMTLDYDVDPYKRGVGTASFIGSDPQVQGSSDETAPDLEGNTDQTQPDIEGNSDNSGTSDYEEDSGSTYSSIRLDTSQATAATISPSGADTAGIFIWVTCSRNISSTINSLDIRVVSDETFTEYFGNWFTPVAKDDANGEASAYFACFIPENTSFADYDVTISTNGPDEDNWQVQVSWITMQRHAHGSSGQNAEFHPHGSSGQNAEFHPHTDGSYEVDNVDIDQIEIGDDVSDAANLNATSVNYYLDYWDGSSWQNKYSVTGTGKTLDTDVDLTNGGTYPDSTGYWRVRVETDSSNADYVQGIVKIKHAMDN